MTDWRVFWPYLTESHRDYMEQAEMTWHHPLGEEFHRRGLIVAAATLAGLADATN